MSEDDPDPFEELDPDEDREGDPFERLGPSSDPDTESPADETAPAEEFGIDGPVSDPGSQSTSDDNRPEEGVNDEPTAPADERDIFSSADADTPRPERLSDADDPFSGGESAFERVDVDQVDADEVWAELAADDADDAASESRYAEVSKHRYCEQCEHFSAPPNAHCTNEGTEIMEFIDMETVRLLDCPVVAEQRSIDDEQ